MIPIALKKWLGIPHSCKEPSSIFVGLIGGVGDLISAAPSIAALKRKYPDAKISFGVGGDIFLILLKMTPTLTILKPHFSMTFGKSEHVERPIEKNIGSMIWFFS